MDSSLRISIFLQNANQSIYRPSVPIIAPPVPMIVPPTPLVQRRNIIIGPSVNNDEVIEIARPNRGLHIFEYVLPGWN